MTGSKQCSYYRNSGTSNIERGIGYCDLDCDRSNCDGEIKFFKKTDVLRNYLSQHEKREGDFQWKKRRNPLFSGDQRVLTFEGNLVIR
jgi:hypothetical protein